MMVADRPYSGLHVILSDRPKGSDPFGRWRDLGLVASIVAAGPSVIQYRRKLGAPEEWLSTGRDVREITLLAGVRFVVNDHAGLAHELGADGVHLGAEDRSVEDVRRQYGDRLAIGRTTRTAADIEEAEEDKAAYVGFGPVWGTTSKNLDIEPRGLDRLASVSSVASIPVIAIGGIDLERADRAMRAGADGVAVIKAVEDHSDPPAVVARLVECLRRSAASD